jgi:hypothetical protein
MKIKKLIMSLVATAVVGVGASAQAQDSTPPPPPSEPPPATHSSGGGSLSLSGGAGIGVGASLTLSGVSSFVAPAAQFVYDTSMFHIEALFGFGSAEVNGMGDRGTEWIFGAGGWYHFHRGASSDFSLGALIAIDTTSGPGPSTTITAFEPGAQVRAFVTPNVAAFGRVGLAFLFGDTGSGTNFGLGGQPTGSFGFTYFFR